MRLRRILPGVTVTVIFADLRNSLHQFSHLALLISFLLHHRKEIVLILVADRWELDLPPVASWYTLRDRSGRGKPFPLGSTKFHEVFERVRGEELAQLLGKLESLRLHRSRHWEIFATGRDPIDSVEAFAASRHRAVYDFGTLKPRTG